MVAAHLSAHYNRSRGVGTCAVENACLPNGLWFSLDTTQFYIFLFRRLNDGACDLYKDALLLGGGEV